MKRTESIPRSARCNSGSPLLVHARGERELALLDITILLDQQGEEARLRFLQEAQLASHIQHPNTVCISDFGGLEDGRTYLGMEFLSGPTLAKALEGGPLGALRSCQSALQIARGLQVIHDQGIIHRDLKPANIFLLPQEAQKGQGAQEGGTSSRLWTSGWRTRSIDDSVNKGRSERSARARSIGSPG